MDQVLKFALGDQVALETPAVTGTVVGRAEYSVGEPTYLVRYSDGDGQHVDVWQGESTLAEV